MLRHVTFTIGIMCHFKFVADSKVLNKGLVESVTGPGIPVSLAARLAKRQPMSACKLAA